MLAPAEGAAAGAAADAGGAILIFMTGAEEINRTVLPCSLDPPRVQGRAPWKRFRPVGRAMPAFRLLCDDALLNHMLPAPSQAVSGQPALCLRLAVMSL